jgi:hypothetical protein
MKNYLQFESSLADDWSWNDKGHVRAPGGLEHAKFLVAHLPSTINLIDGPWNEEDNAWQFLTKINGFSVSVLVGEYYDPVENWLVIVNAVVFFGFLRRQRVTLAVETVTDAIEVILRADARIKNVQRFTEAEFDSLDASSKGT